MDLQGKLRRRGAARLNPIRSQPDLTSAPTKSNAPQRLSFLPRHFGNAMMRFEGAVYAHMGRLCRSYSGGFWTFHELSNGGCFMSPSVAAYRLESPNGFCETVSAPVAGIIATLYALGHLSFEFPDNEIYATRFHQLREFALDHPHADAILEAID